MIKSVQQFDSVCDKHALFQDYYYLLLSLKKKKADHFVGAQVGLFPRKTHITCILSAGKMCFPQILQHSLSFSF